MNDVSYYSKLLVYWSMMNIHAALHDWLIIQSEHCCLLVLSMPHTLIWCMIVCCASVHHSSDQ